MSAVTCQRPQQVPISLGSGHCRGPLTHRDPCPLLLALCPYPRFPFPATPTPLHSTKPRIHTRTTFTPPHPKHQPDPVSLWPSSLCLCVAVFTMFIVVLFPQVLSTIALALFILLAKPFWSAKSWESVKAQELLRCACFHVPYIPPKVQVLPTRRDDERSCQ